MTNDFQKPRKTPNACCIGSFSQDNWGREMDGCSMSEGGGKTAVTVWSVKF